MCRRCSGLSHGLACSGRDAGQRLLHLGPAVPTISFKIKDDINEAIEWLRFQKEKDWGIAEKLKAKKDAGEKYEIEEESDIEEGVELFICEPQRLGGF